MIFESDDHILEVNEIQRGNGSVASFVLYSCVWLNSGEILQQHFLNIMKQLIQHVESNEPPAMLYGFQGHLQVADDDEQTTAILYTPFENSIKEERLQRGLHKLQQSNKIVLLEKPFQVEINMIGTEVI